MAYSTDDFTTEYVSLCRADDIHDKPHDNVVF